MIVWPAKPPEAVEKYAFDFTAALNGATISGTPAVSADGVTKDTQDVSGNLVEVLLSGGTAGTVAKVACTIVTSGGETLSALGVLPIGGEAVSLAEAKAAQRIEGNDEDALLAGFLRAAVRRVESATDKNLTQQVETQVVNGFSASSARGLVCGRPGDAIRLHRGPVSEILEVAYDDSNGVEQTLSSFRLIEGKFARLLPAFNALWPVTAFGQGTVRISYVAGFDPADRDLAELIQAAILLFGHFNANREAVIASDRAAAIALPLGVEALLEPHRSVGIS